ncbi:MAG: endonuclease/exonuclease/phosphatase family protein [Clostridiaceae bacterium]|nr:endonuclease/exonuclease/phosphatase family protein [Clostridiaceae bacterium]
MNLRLMTYNIQHGIDYMKQLANNSTSGMADTIDLDLIASVIREQQPDIVGLNEVRGAGQAYDYIAQAEELAAKLDYHCYFACALKFDGKNPYGNAILSKYPIQSVETVTIMDPPVQDEDAYYETRCVLRAHFLEAGGFTVLISHFGLAKSEQRNAVARVRELLAKENCPVIVMGDFNMTPEDPNLAPLLEEMDDTASVFTHPQLSFPSDHPEIKIDYILCRGCRILEADIPAITASDHRPHTARIELGL